MYQSQDHKMSDVNASRVRLAARNRCQRTTAVLTLCRDGNAVTRQHGVLNNTHRAQFARDSSPLRGVHGIEAARHCCAGCMASKQARHCCAGCMASKQARHCCAGCMASKQARHCCTFIQPEPSPRGLFRPSGLGIRILYAFAKETVLG
jgi:hypothetical protein